MPGSAADPLGNAQPWTSPAPHRSRHHRAAAVIIGPDPVISRGTVLEQVTGTGWLMTIGVAKGNCVGQIVGVHTSGINA